LILNRTLFLVPLPGAIHGSAIVSQYLIDNGVQATLDIVGNEADLTIDYLKYKCLGYEKSIIVHRPIFGYEKWNIFKKSNILLFPITYPKECLPLVIIEALAYYLPMISFNTGGVRDMIIHGHNELILSGLLSSGKVQEAAEIIVGFSADEWLEMSQSAFSSYQSNYTLDNWVSGIHKILNE